MNSYYDPSLKYNRLKVLKKYKNFNFNKFDISDKKKLDIFFDKNKIKILEGCIFVGMCARHYDSLNRQKAMFLTGLEILNEVYEKI